jgi:hypothetical protein
MPATVGRRHSYTGFARLLRADGYIVRDTFEVFDPNDPDCAINLIDNGNCSYFEELRSIDTLVISNAKVDYSAAEVALIAGWLSGDLGCSTGCSGRRLLLIADHEPNPSYIQEFAQVFGLDWPDGVVSERKFSANPPGDPDTTGILDTNHPIVVGSQPGETVVSVTTFAGSAFTRLAPDGSEVSLLTLPLNENQQHLLNLMHWLDGA